MLLKQGLVFLDGGSGGQMVFNRLGLPVRLIVIRALIDGALGEGHEAG